MLPLLKLKIGPSLIPNVGKGVFARDTKKSGQSIVFKPGETIVKYDGQIITNGRRLRRYGDDHTGPYLVELRMDHRYEDAALFRGVGSLINHKAKNRAYSDTDMRQPVNVKMRYTRRNVAAAGQPRRMIADRVVIKASRNIRNNEELYTDYGTVYDFDEVFDTRYVRK
jgi:SET domain-containing protein